MYLDNRPGQGAEMKGIPAKPKSEVECIIADLLETILISEKRISRIYNHLKGDSIECEKSGIPVNSGPGSCVKEHLCRMISQQQYNNELLESISLCLERNLGDLTLE